MRPVNWIQANYQSLARFFSNEDACGYTTFLLFSVSHVVRPQRRRNKRHNRENERRQGRRNKVKIRRQTNEKDQDTNATRLPYVEQRSAVINLKGPSHDVS